MPATYILYPIAAMVVLVFVVVCLTVRERVFEFKFRKIHPQKLPSSSQMLAVLENTRAADNYKNLFEMPVLFYALCLALYATNLVSLGMLIAAWAYVALRVAHSAIHIGYNKVMHRFKVFLCSALLLSGMWTAFVVQLINKA
jgi:hypothetical protein